MALELFLLLGTLLFPRLGHCQKHRQGADALLTSLFITENVPKPEATKQHIFRSGVRLRLVSF